MNNPNTSERIVAESFSDVLKMQEVKKNAVTQYAAGIYWKIQQKEKQIEKLQKELNSLMGEEIDTAEYVRLTTEEE